MRLWMRAFPPALVAALLAAIPAGAQQTGTVTGVVKNAATGEPLPSAQVSIQGTGYGSLTQADGRYTITNVPAGQRTVRVDVIGFATKTQTVNVPAGGTVAANFDLQTQAVELSAVVVTGVAGATQKTKLPFEVAQVRAADLNKAPQANPLASLQGKVAGATVVSGSGRPGSTPSLLLRGVKSLNASGRDQEPLYIVDGVILSGGLVDLDPLDIESIEVVKGAAAASLYGSRAENGVVQIRTKRGAARDNNSVRYTLRSEIGRSELAHVPDKLLTTAHEYKLTADGKFVNADGSSCDWLFCKSPVLAAQKAAPGEAASAWNTYQTESWPGQTYNQVERFFRSSTYRNLYFAAEGRSGATNYHVSASNLEDPGVMPGMKGFNRTNVRVNVDQNVLPSLQVQSSALYSRSTQGQFPETQGNPLFDLTRMPAGVDLTSKDPNDSTQLVLFVDPVNNESPNPLYAMYTRKYTEQHSRFLGSANVRYSPMNWLDVEANASFDRLDLDQQDYYPKGYRTLTPSASYNNGRLDEFRRRDEALNASITGTMRFNLTDRIQNRTQLRYLYENQTRNQVDAFGYRFAVADVPTFENIDPTTLDNGSYSRTIRADGYFAITNFDMFDRYVVDALVRNDGSSLFGADERRQWYYRFAGAWRISQEPFFHVPGIDELKLRYSVGTAGGRPNFEAQYETYSVSGGRITPVTLGNRNLKPERSLEQEVGLDAGLLHNNVTLTVTYAHDETKDQILPVPLPAYTGFSTQWQNAGTVLSKTWEATLDARLVQTRDFSWSAKVLFDRTRSRITALSAPPFQYGVPGQGLGTVFYARPGEEVGTFYGVHYATSCADLPTGVSCDGFKVNDDGLLVWVGKNGSFDNPQWGTDSDVKIRGSSVKWGTPFAGECTDRSTGQRTLFCPVGKSMPDYTLGVSTNLSWRGISLYALVNRVSGFSVYNQPLQWATFKRWSGIMDQRGVPENQQKPIGYFDAMYGVSGLQPSNLFVEDASFTKLREVSLSYRLDQNQLSKVGLGRLSGLGINLSGRNLYTWTKYRGFDPEVGKAGGDTGSSAIARVEGYQYPNFRTWTVSFDVNF
ncbi:MAG: SusC/RagA family TonB-linked outer membrane protein [Gemmatimonadetes bacterium]|nr:SusC/RagA family TonB-linked outer membrane protein [Gemmatimonadota bacterium]